MVLKFYFVNINTAGFELLWNIRTKELYFSFDKKAY